MNPAAIPTVENILGISAPVLVRKINRARHWDNTNSSLDDKLEYVDDVFLPDEHDTYSLYLVKSDVDLHRVAIGFNSLRGSLFEDLHLLGFKIDEIEQSDMVWSLHRDDATLCFGANKLHVNVVASRDSVRLLCRLALQASRERGRLNKGKMKTLARLVGDHGCRAVEKTSNSCECD